MDIKEVTNKEVWEEFLAECKEKTFMQSWAWGEFQQGMGNRAWRMGVFEGGELVAVALVVRVQAKRGTFLMVQHGPVLAKRGIFNFQFSIFKTFLEELKKISKQERASFIRMAPLWERTEENERMFRKLGFREAPMHANAYESSWKLDLAQTEDKLLAGMRKTTRYVIRQTSKNEDIVVEKSTTKEDREMFVELNKNLARRQNFVPFSRRLIEAELVAFAKDDEVVLFLGKYQGKVVAGALVVYWSGIGFYHQAASKKEYARLSIPYLVQWEAIKEAKRRGCKLYDFWGYVDPKQYPGHPWAGPTLFKMGFGGKPYEYVKTQDYPLSWKYWPVAMFETLRAKRRGL